MADNSYGWFGFIGKIVDFLKYLISFFAGRSDAEKKRKEEEDRKKAEQEKDLMQRQLFASSKLASLGELAAGLAHEINNPLAVIIGYTEIINFVLNNNETTKEQLKENINKISYSAHN